jgi:carboxypeptidase T
MKFTLLAFISILSINIQAHQASPFEDWLQEPAHLTVSVKVKGQEDLSLFNHMGLDIAGVDSELKRVDLLINQKQFHYLQFLGKDLFVRRSRLVERAPDSEYKNPSEIEAILQDYAAKYPDLTKLKIIGKTFEGRNIYAIKISSDPDGSGQGRPSILFNSMHHAREVMSPEAALDIIETLLTSYSHDLKIKSWVDQYDVWIVPMLNPDGNNKVWTKDAWWRKNTSGSSGVDVNRNYPYKWGACQGSSGFPMSDTYRGPSAGSELETQAMMNLVKTTRPVFSISFHSYSEIVIYPLGCKGQKTLTKEIIEPIGNKIGELISYKAGTAWELLYSVDGGDIDWMYEQYGVLPYVIELNSSKEGFQPNYKATRDQTVKRIRAGWQYLFERMDMGSIRGQIQDGKATRIEVYNAQTNSLIQTAISRDDGYYTLILNPGTYQLKFYTTDGEKTIVQKLESSALVLDI